MRKSDKKHNIAKVNLLAEQRHLESKGLISESSHIPNGMTTGFESMGSSVNENPSNNIEDFKSDLEMSYYNIGKQIESKISELKTEFNQNEDTIYKLESLMNETQRLTDYLSEIR